MSTEQRMVARVPSKPLEDGVNWLVLEPDPDSHGWFLYFHQSLGEPCVYDNWYLKREQALAQAEGDWGIGSEDWMREE